MKTFIKKCFIVFIFAVGFMFLVGNLIHIGNKEYTYVDYQILYDLDYPQTQLNNHSLREVFENRNMAMPDLEDKEYLGDGWYQLVKTDTRDYRYNVYNGYWFLDGNYITTTLSNELFKFNLEVGQEYTVSIYYVSGEGTNTVLRGMNGRHNVSIINSGSVTWDEQEGGRWDQT